MKNRNKKTKKGLSLAEVLIVLGIISTTLVVSVNFIAQSLVNIKANEIEDASSSIMLEALEIAKAPNKINIDGVPTGGNNYYKLVKNQSEAYLEKVVATQEISDCTSNSQYNVNNLLGSIDASFNVCVQVIITSANQGALDVFQIKSKTVYQIPSDTRVNSIIGYRYEEFTER